MRITAIHRAATMVLTTALSFTAAAYTPAGDNIRSSWAAQVNENNARTEYPRPQMVRPEWVCLNGLWQYAVTDRNAARMETYNGDILVPFCIESSLSGVCKPVTPEQALWYRTKVKIPRKWKDSRVLLHFDAVDWKAEVFVDSEKVGEHTGGYTAFAIDITEYLKAPEIELTVKVWDPCDDRTYNVPHGKQTSNPGSIWYTSVTGIWQSVWMEAVSREAYIADYNVKTDISGNIEVFPAIEGARQGDKVKVELLQPAIGYDPEKPGRKVKGAVSTAAAGESLKLNLGGQQKLWTPEGPYLYGMYISLIRDGRVIDKVSAYTAIRSISIRKDIEGVKRLALNDKTLFQFGPLDQGWWPDGLYTAPTAEAMLYDIQKTKQFGFNMIRKHIKIEPSRWYYDCDREGIMVWQDMPITMNYPDRSYWAQGKDVYGAGKDCPLTDAQKENYYKEWGEIMSQLNKFQCIVVWIPFNEAWGQFDTKAVADWTAGRDSTRLVNAASGGNWHKGAGQLLDSHHYPTPQMRILDEDMVNVLGEYGGIARIVPDHMWKIDRKWGYVQYDTEEKTTDVYVRYADDLLKLKFNEGCAAAVYTQTTDVEGEINGLLTYDRAVVKVNAEKVKEANRKVIETKVPVIPVTQ